MASGTPAAAAAAVSAVCASTMLVGTVVMWPDVVMVLMCAGAGLITPLPPDAPSSSSMASSFGTNHTVFFSDVIHPRAEIARRNRIPPSLPRLRTTGYRGMSYACAHNSPRGEGGTADAAETRNGRAAVASRLGTGRDYRRTTRDRRTARLSKFLSEDPMEIKRRESDKKNDNVRPPRPADTARNRVVTIVIIINK